MIEISKELLREIYTGKYIILGKVWIEDESIRFTSLNNCNISHRINIYKFAHMCKKWALNKNFTLSSSMEIDCGYCDILFIVNNEPKHNLITGISEVEAVIKACEWILKEMKC